MTYVYNFEEYYCFCESFLFNSSDIEKVTNFFNQRYYWVKPQRKNYELLYGRVNLYSNNLMKCTKCYRRVGIIIYPCYGTLEILRFDRNRTYWKKTIIVKENGNFKSY